VIYFDNNATTPLIPEVRDVMAPFWDQAYGNPSSVHSLGTAARVALDSARKKLAGVLGVTTGELIFTGCGSEANNQAIVGTLLTHFPSTGPTRNLVISDIEHPAIKETAAWAAARFGFELRVAPIRFKGNNVDTAPFLELIDTHTVLVSVMMANNETGLVLPLAPIFAAAKAVGATCHTDAVQGLGKLTLNPKALGVDLMSFSAHKFHGPKGVGGLYIRRGQKLEPLIHGGPQENTRRAGTENVAFIVGMAEAAAIAVETSCDGVRQVRDYFETRLEQFGNLVQINFKDMPRTPNASSVQFRKQDGNLMLIKLDRGGIAISTGAACSSGSLSPSKGLLAMGLSEKEAQSTLRFSFSKLNTCAEVDACMAVLSKLVRPR